MPLTISSLANTEKNKISSSWPWFVLIKITLLDDTEIFVCNNNENVTWPVSGGDIYASFPFKLGVVGESAKGEIPSLKLQVSNVTRTMEAYLNQSNGGKGAEVIIMLVHSKHTTTDSKGEGTNNVDPENAFVFTVIDTKTNSQWATFKLGASNPYRMRSPTNRMLKTFCSHRTFKGSRCQYTGPDTTCDRTLAECRNKNNSINFGGTPGVGQRAIYIG